jgi:hypothetical protein
MGVEPIGDRIACHPPVLKTGTITGPHALPLFSFNNIQLICQRFCPCTRRSADGSSNSRNAKTEIPEMRMLQSEHALAVGPQAEHVG